METKKIVTLKDIAQRTGFSTNTVARALKNRNDVAPESKALIRAVAEEMHYINNSAASYLRTGQSKTLAVILADIANPTFSAGVRDIEQSAVNDGYSIMIFNTNEDESAERTAILTAIGKNADGILICPCGKSRNNLEFLAKTNVPFVLVGRKGDPAYPWVVRDDVECGRLIARHLIQNGGCRSILVINGDPALSSASERSAGFLEEIRREGLTQDPELCFEADVKVGTARRILKKVRAKGLSFDGIFGFSDIIAMEAINELKRQGKRVPEDVSVAGVDNLSQAYSYLLPVDSVGEVGQSLYSACYRKLIGLINGDDTMPLHTTLNVKLNLYGSVFCGKTPL